MNGNCGRFLLQDGSCPGSDLSGIHPLPAQPLPPVCFGLLAHVKAYELLTVQAAAFGDRRAAYQALIVHALGPPVAKAHELLEDLLLVNKAHLPQFDQAVPIGSV